MNNINKSIAAALIQNGHAQFGAFREKQIFISSFECFDWYEEIEIKTNSALCCCSSGNIPLQLALNNFKQIDCFDRNPLAEPMLYLIITCIMSLDKKDFISFFGENNCSRKEDYYRNLDYDVFSKRITPLLSDEIKDFWEHCYKMADSIPEDVPVGTKLRGSGLFNMSSINYNEQMMRSSHFLNHYYRLREKLSKTSFSFTECDLFELISIFKDNKYDLIYLSNIFEFINSKSLDEFNDFIKRMKESITENDGFIMAMYIIKCLDERNTDKYALYRYKDLLQKQFLGDYEKHIILSPRYESSGTKDAVYLYKG